MSLLCVLNNKNYFSLFCRDFVRALFLTLGKSGIKGYVHKETLQNTQSLFPDLAYFFGYTFTFSKKLRTQYITFSVLLLGSVSKLIRLCKQMCAL